MGPVTQLPAGARDWQADELKLRLDAQEALMECFLMSGYSRLETPVLEYYDLFAEGFSQRDVVKTFDHEGSILALRPDSTVPIARLAMTKLAGGRLPLRLCSAQRVFSGSGARREYDQAGVEALGLPGVAGDVEVIALAIDALSAAGLRDFQVEIGHVGFFKALMREAGLSPDRAEQVRHHVEEKNMLGISLLLKDSTRPADKLMQLPALFGGREVFERARALCQGPESETALDECRAAYDSLAELGYEGLISVDLGMVHRIQYYTASIFKGITSHLGQPLMQGGRYDGTLVKGMPATGFAIDVWQLTEALEKQSLPCPQHKRLAVVGYEKGYLKPAYDRAARLKSEGCAVALCHESDFAAADTDARAMGAHRLWHIGKKGVREW